MTELKKGARVVTLTGLDIRGCLFNIPKGSKGALKENRAMGVSLVRFDGKTYDIAVKTAHLALDFDSP